MQALTSTKQHKGLQQKVHNRCWFWREDFSCVLCSAATCYYYSDKVDLCSLVIDVRLALYVEMGGQIKATNSKKISKQTVETLTCETVFACLFWRGSHSPALTFIYPHRMHSYTFSSRVPCFLWVFPQLPIQTAWVWNRLCTILKMLFSH